MPRVPIKEYVDQLRDADKEALAIAKTDIDRRLVGMNEFREQLKDERLDYLRTETYEPRHRELEQKIEAISERFLARIALLEQWQANVMGRFVAFGLVGSLIIATLTYIIAHALSL